MARTPLPFTPVHEADTYLLALLLVPREPTGLSYLHTRLLPSWRFLQLQTYIVASGLPPSLPHRRRLGSEARVEVGEEPEFLVVSQKHVWNVEAGGGGEPSVPKAVPSPPEVLAGQ